MRFGNRIRFIAAGLLGVVVDLLVMGDAYAYSTRMRQSHPVTLVAGLVGMVVVTAFLNFGKHRTFAIAAIVWLGMVAAHTLVLIAEMSRDPTSHNLWPFEYLSILLFGIPALLGATAGRLADAVRTVRARNKI